MYMFTEIEVKGGRSFGGFKNSDHIYFYLFLFFLCHVKCQMQGH